MNSAEELYPQLISGNRRALSKSISLVESTLPAHRTEAEKLLKLCSALPINSRRIAITGVPGAGKSTSIEALGMHYILQGKKVAVLAIDPSSSRGKGSILGDKTRMELLSAHPMAYIRPTPTRGFLGGIGAATAEAIKLVEAAGYDTILIETVGVGQSETLATEVSDMMLMIYLTGAGDELQGVKKGIMEVIDLIFINKIENNEAAITRGKKTKAELHRALHFLQEKDSGCGVIIKMGSALENFGIAELAQSIDEHFIEIENNGYLEKKREEQALHHFKSQLQRYLLIHLESLPSIQKLIKKNSLEKENFSQPSAIAKEIITANFPTTS